MSRSEQKEKRRQEILLAGLDLFIRKGYAATKVTDIAAAVGMSTGLLFHYFSSKEKLYEELVRQGAGGPQSVMAVASMEPLDFFTMAAEQILSYIGSDPFVAKMFVLMTQAMYTDAAPPAVKEVLRDMRAVEQSVEIIKKGQQQGQLREGEPLALSIAFWGAINGVAEQVALNPDLPCPAPEWIVDIIRKKENG